MIPLPIPRARAAHSRAGSAHSACQGRKAEHLRRRMCMSAAAVRAGSHSRLAAASEDAHYAWCGFFGGRPRGVAQDSDCHARLRERSTRARGSWATVACDHRFCGACGAAHLAHRCSGWIAACHPSCARCARGMARVRTVGVGKRIASCVAIDDAVGVSRRAATPRRHRGADADGADEPPHLQADLDTDV